LVATLLYGYLESKEFKSNVSYNEIRGVIPANTTESYISFTGERFNGDYVF